MSSIKKTAIWKFDLVLDEYQEIDMPYGAHIIHVGSQDRDIKLWAIANIDAPMQTRKFLIYGTGHLHETIIPNNHIGTVQIGAYVWHIFEEV